MIFATALVAAALAQQPAAPPAAPPEVTTLDARLGMCSADFTVKDAAGMPVYAAMIHVRVRYGFMSVKRMDLEVGTNSDGKARLTGLPEKAKPLAFEIAKGETKGTAGQDLAKSCSAAHDITLK